MGLGHAEPLFSVRNSDERVRFLGTIWERQHWLYGPEAT